MNLFFLSINNNYVKHVQHHVKCISLDFNSVFGHLIGYEDIYQCDPVQQMENDNLIDMFNHHL